MSVSAKSPGRVVLLSVDGLHPRIYRAPEFAHRFPNLLELESSGARAEAVETVYPSTTYPAHATVVTGVPPRVHGVYSHLASLDPTEKARPWCWHAKILEVPALWDAVRASRRRTAALSWPVSAGAPIDHNIPEIWNPAAPDPHADFETPAQHATPGLFAEVTQVLTPMLGTADPDQLRGEAALYLLKHYQPDLLMVHFVWYDSKAHTFGTTSPEALHALESADKAIGRIRDAVSSDPATNLVVISDHGFAPVKKEAAPLAVFVKHGLFAKGADGSVALRRLGAVNAGGSMALYWLEKPSADDRRRLEAALESLQQSGAVESIIDRGKLEAMGADPDAELIIEAAAGCAFTDRFDGPIVSTAPRELGAHGYLPTRPGMDAMFVAAGRDIEPRKNLGRISLKRIAPTLAKLLDLPPGVLATNEEPVPLNPD